MPSRFLKPFERFFEIEASSGAVLLIVTALALVWANSPWSAAYDSIWPLSIRLGVGRYSWQTTLHFLVNDSLMTVFFLLVGLEIRRELHDGVLSNLRQALLPLAAALGGIIAPALIYLALVANEELRPG
jgi:NhaA family Na+:H+ antiporter